MMVRTVLCLVAVMMLGCETLSQATSRQSNEIYFSFNDSRLIITQGKLVLGQYQFNQYGVLLISESTRDKKYDIAFIRKNGDDTINRVLPYVVSDRVWGILTQRFTIYKNGDGFTATPVNNLASQRAVQ